MQYFYRGVGKHATVDIRLELAREPVTRGNLPHVVEQLAIFVQEVKPLRVLLAGLVIQGKGLVAKPVLEQRLDAVVAFRSVGRVLRSLLQVLHPGKRRLGSHGHAACVRHLELFEQFIFHELHAAPVRVVAQREIADAVEERLARKGILVLPHVRFGKEVPCPATAPQKRLLRGFGKCLLGFGETFLLEVDKPYAELCPLTFLVVSEPSVRKLLESHHRTVVVFLLLVLESLHPQAVRIFLAVLVRALQHGIEPADFLRVLRGKTPEKAERRLNPHGASLHGIHQELVLRNRLVTAAHRLERLAALAPQHNARIQVERALRKLLLQRISGRRHRRFRVFRHQALIKNPYGIEKPDTRPRFFLCAGHLRIRDLLRERFREGLHLAETPDCRKCGIPVWGRCREQLHVVAFRLLFLLVLFQIRRVAVLEGGGIVALRELIEKSLQGIRLHIFRKRRVGQCRLHAEPCRRACERLVLREFCP